MAARDEVRRFIVEAFWQLSVDEVVRRLDDAHIANAEVRHMHAVWDHPQLRARNRWREVDSPVGPIPALLPPGAWKEQAPRMDRIPALGEHTEAILSAMGYDSRCIATLREENAI